MSNDQHATKQSRQRSVRTTFAPSIDEHANGPASSALSLLPTAATAAAAGTSRFTQQTTATTRERQRSSTSLTKSRSSIVAAHQDSSSSSSRDGSHGDRANDSASHFFAIETRVALQERLVTLQTALHDLLVRTKLAWMKCFATSAARAGVTSDAQLDAATELVTTGEQLLTTLERAFAAATAVSSVPIDTFSALVDNAERDVAEFEQLVQRVATQPFDTSAMPPPASRTYELQTQVTYDLPSMKTYCARVAPSYTSYLPAHGHRKPKPRK